MINRNAIRANWRLLLDFAGAPCVSKKMLLINFMVLLGPFCKKKGEPFQLAPTGGFISASKLMGMLCCGCLKGKRLNFAAREVVNAGDHPEFSLVDHML